MTEIEQALQAIHDATEGGRWPHLIHIGSTKMRRMMAEATGNQFAHRAEAPEFMGIPYFVDLRDPERFFVEVRD